MLKDPMSGHARVFSGVEKFTPSLPTEPHDVRARVRAFSGPNALADPRAILPDGPDGTVLLGINLFKQEIERAVDLPTEQEPQIHSTGLQSRMRSWPMSLVTSCNTRRA
jgi:hypothetical protein